MIYLGNEFQETDIALARLAITYDRSTAVDFSVPYYNEPMAIIIQHKMTDESLLGLIEIFSPAVWIFYLLSIFLACFVIWLLRIFAPVEGDEGAETLASSAWYVYSAQVNQSNELCTLLEVILR